jgi:hypothetical protein
VGTTAVRDVYQADAAQYEWEKGRLTLRRWKVYEFTYVVDNKNDHPIDHFYLEVRTPSFTFYFLFLSSKRYESLLN